MARKRSGVIGNAGYALLSAALAAVLAAAGCDFLPQPPKADTPLESRGRHVLQIAGACGCHGPNFAGWRAGGPDTFPRAAPFGERFTGPFGAVPASNITPDAETGIGEWTDDQIRQAVTRGIDRAGRRLSPIMPYHAYSGMADSDVTALIAYLRRLRPVRNEVPDRELAAPVPEPDAPPSAPVDRPGGGIELGRYLVRHVSGCADCHAPGGNGADAALLVGKSMRIGAESVVAPNITPDRETGIGAWSEAAVARYLRTGSRPDGGLAHSVMAGLVLSSFSHYTPEEARAVAAYLKSLPPVRHRP